jgi:Ser/Thr protein kinase RdoA (MazF antagonist)
LEYLKGGRENKIARSGATVHRPSGHWSKSVHALLNHLRKVGFLNAPKPLGFDEKGNEILTYISGEVSNYPLSKTASSNEALITGAQLLRAYHDATVSFLNNSQQNHSWLLPVRNPAEVICHGDFAPYNVVLNGCKAIAIIDFDTAHPGPRIWDIAYALYRWSPLKNPNNPDTQGNLVSQIYRARQFCDAYHLPAVERVNLLNVMIERLQTLITYMHAEAQKGNTAFQANLAEGHHIAYKEDIAYLHENRTQIETGLYS